MLQILFNGHPVMARDGATILEAAYEDKYARTQFDLEIPTLQYLKGVQEKDDSGVCIVEVQGKGIVNAAATLIEPDMKVITDSAAVRFEQTKALKEMGTELDYAIDIEVPDQNIIERMGGRRACVSCGATYHLVNIPPKTEGKCDKCGSDLILRDDDKPETVKKRLDVYHEQTQPLIEYYQELGLLREVDGTVQMNEVFDAIAAILGA